MPATPLSTLRPARTIWAVFAYMAAFGLIIALVSHYYLIPAIVAAHGASPEQKKMLAVYSRLLLTVVLFVLWVGLLLTFRVGRFFFPRRREPVSPTKYVDAWQEAGRRLKVEGDDDEKAE